MDKHHSYFAGGVLVHNCHQMTKTGQNTLLKVLEEAPSYAYIILCTTDPDKLIKTVRNRCSRISVKPIDNFSMGEIIDRVLLGEQREIPAEVRSKLVEYAGGSARKAITKLQQCLAATQPNNMLALIQQEEEFEKTISDLCSMFTDANTVSWREVAKIYESLTEEPETIRRALMGWLASALLRGWAKRNVPDVLVAGLMRILQYNTYDNGKSQLSLMLYECWMEKERFFKSQNK